MYSPVYNSLYIISHSLTWYTDTVYNSVGADCSSTYQRGVWTLEETSGEVPSGRASHRTVIHNNELWVISGDHLGNQPFHQLSKYVIFTKHVKGTGKELFEKSIQIFILVF